MGGPVDPVVFLVKENMGLMLCKNMLLISMKST